jgi:hypothetical protein
MDEEDNENDSTTNNENIDTGGGDFTGRDKVTYTFPKTHFTTIRGVLHKIFDPEHQIPTNLVYDIIEEEEFIDNSIELIQRLPELDIIILNDKKWRNWSQYEQTNNTKLQQDYKLIEKVLYESKIRPYAVDRNITIHPQVNRIFIYNHRSYISNKQDIQDMLYLISTKEDTNITANKVLILPQKTIDKHYNLYKKLFEPNLGQRKSIQYIIYGLYHTKDDRYKKFVFSFEENGKNQVCISTENDIITQLINKYIQPFKHKANDIKMFSYAGILKDTQYTRHIPESLNQLIDPNISTSQVIDLMSYIQSRQDKKKQYPNQTTKIA